MRAIAYFSIAGGTQSEAVLAEQQETFSGFCQHHGHQPVATFVERGGENSERGQYQEMVDYLKNSGRECLVMIEGPQHLGDTLESSVRRVLELDSLGTRTLCWDEDMPDPLQKALRYWSSRGGDGTRGERIRKAMMSRAMRGEGLGKPPFGYRIGQDSKLEVVVSEADTVRLIFDLYTKQDLGMRRIVRHLNEQGAPTRTGGGWSIVTVRDVLRNRAYLGTYARFGMRVPRSHQPIIESPAFTQAQDMMTQRRTPRVSRPAESFLLAGLAFCAACGNKMIGVSRRQAWSRKDGSRTIGHYRYYQCQSRTNQGMCRYHTWRADALEQSVLEQTKTALDQGSTSLSTATNTSRLSSETARGEKRLEGKFTKALESAAAGTISLEHMRTILEEIDTERSILRREPGAPNSWWEAPAQEDGEPIIQQWASLDKATLGHLVHALVSRVSVADDSAHVTFIQEE